MKLKTFIQSIRPSSTGTLKLRRKDIKLLKPYVGQLQNKEVSRTFKCTINDMEWIAVYQRDVDLLSIIPLSKGQDNIDMIVIQTNKLNNVKFIEDAEKTWTLEITTYQDKQFELHGNDSFLIVRYLSEWLTASNKLKQVKAKSSEQLKDNNVHVAFPDGSAFSLNNGESNVVHVLPSKGDKHKPKMYQQLVDKHIDKVVDILNGSTSIIRLLQYKKAINVLYSEGRLSENEYEILLGSISQNIIRFKQKSSVIKSN